MNTNDLLAGAAAADISPRTPVFLYGYPNVPRYSTGIHDPLLASALFLQSGRTRVLFVACDIIYMPKGLVGRARRRIEQAAGIPAGNVLISASHTHSGPKTLDPVATSGDEVVPPADMNYVAFLEEAIVDAATRAAANAVAAEAGLAVADAEGIGTNRRDPAGVKDLAVPVLLVRDLNRKPLAAMLVCSMHPTVLHEDSTLVSGDFPALARLHLQRELLGKDVPVLCHTGPAGDQSPRHVTRGNTFAEAERLGRILAEAVMAVIPSIRFHRQVTLEARSGSVTIPLRTFMSESDARAKLEQATARLRRLQEAGAPRVEVRTAEVDFFGAQETLTLARAAAGGAVDAAARGAMPAEVQVIRIGPWAFVAWPGEMFVQFALDVKARCPDTFIIAYANGELQGYLVTQQAADEGGYESSNAIFKSPEGGEMLVARALELLADRAELKD